MYNMSCDQSKIWAVVDKEIVSSVFTARFPSPKPSLYMVLGLQGLSLFNTTDKDDGDENCWTVTITVSEPNQYTFILNINYFTTQYIFFIIIFSIYYFSILAAQCTTYI